jgi:hypothetical protein
VLGTWSHVRWYKHFGGEVYSTRPAPRADVSGQTPNYSHSCTSKSDVRRCIQKFPDLPPEARTANGTALCHQVQLHHYYVSQSSEFSRHNPLCCLSTCVYGCTRLFRYRLSPEIFGYTLVREHNAPGYNQICFLDYPLMTVFNSSVISYFI